ncbi:MAG TPA: hypothetical protein VLR71_02260 [Casimicrobiaceae bacterium]|nr:hypothetical protein [Casimicrobiaceae bacterium]
MNVSRFPALYLRVVALAFAALLLTATRPAAAALLDAVEFYNAALDHYFVTASSDEINKLDTGFFTGWKRTGLSFKVADPTTPSTALSPVCRFYGSPSAGLDSHFYSASPSECAAVKQKYPGVWIFESDDVFNVGLPDPITGACANGSAPIYRAWNNRIDSNHRYTTDAAVQQSMIAKGYIAEGYGPPAMPVAMCSPVADPAARPSCTLAASNGFPVANTPVNITATCTNGPTAFSWTGCSSLTSVCTANSPTPGTVTYTVVASNANGPGAPASIDIAWQAPPPPESPPVCTLSATMQTDPPVVGNLITLEAFCGGNPTAYQWTGCITSSNICQLRGQAVGGQTISVSGSNAGGQGNTASVFVNWVASAPAPLGQCAQFPSALYSEAGSANTTVYSSFFPDLPGFAYNGAWAVRFTVPATAQPGAFGSLAAAEFSGPPTFREITVSQQACDFRPTDLTGANGPYGRQFGNSATLPFTIGAGNNGLAGLAAGQTYWVNVRNNIPGQGLSCPASQGRCNALVSLLLPH